MFPVSHFSLQLVCLSATLPNTGTLAKWLNASVYETAFRPVELRHRVCKGRQIYVARQGDTRDGDKAIESGALVNVSLVLQSLYAFFNRGLLPGW